MLHREIAILPSESLLPVCQFALSGRPDERGSGLTDNRYRSAISLMPCPRSGIYCRLTIASCLAHSLTCKACSTSALGLAAGANPSRKGAPGKCCLNTRGNSGNDVCYAVRKRSCRPVSWQGNS